jgi:prepilin-type processing-associated H-X9-DG protein
MFVVAGFAACFALANLGFHAVATAREAGHRSQCVNNLKSIGLALHNYGLHNYGSSNQALPFGTIPADSLQPEKRTGWLFTVIPYLEQLGGELEYDPHEPWDSARNRRIFVSGGDEGGKPFRWELSELAVFRCPSNPGQSKPGQASDTTFAGIAGLGVDAATLPMGHKRAGIFGYNRFTAFRDITDGLSNTMMVAETIRNNGPWPAGGFVSVRGVDPAKPPYLGGPKCQFGGTHPGGANVLFADGSVRFVRETIAPSTFEALSTISGSEPTPGWPPN